jgi:hypothetical protein
MHRRRTHWRVQAVAMLLGGGLTTQTASAQRGIELGPYLGVYVPTTSFESAPILVPIALPADSRHDAALLLGAEAIFWLGGGLGIAADWGVSASKVRTTSGGVDMTLSAKVNAGTLRLLVPLRVPSLHNRVHLDAGVALIHRSGDFYESYRDKSNVAAVLGIGSELRLAPQINAHLQLSGYLYSMRLRETDGTEFKSSFQTDILARAGVAWAPTF